MNKQSFEEWKKGHDNDDKTNKPVALEEKKSLRGSFVNILDSSERDRQGATRSSLLDVADEYNNNATPRQGAIEYDSGYNASKHKEEIKIANWLHEVYGGDIKLLSEANEFGVKMPDYNWRGKLWELKTTSTANATDTAVRKAVKQIQANPGGIILDYSDNDVDINEMVSVIAKRVVRCNFDGFDILIRSKGEPIKILRYKK